MHASWFLMALLAPVGWWLGLRVRRRWQLSRAKHPSLQRACEMVEDRLARLLPFYE
ncbi:MAG: hypothetical protein R2712_24890 [Vicinamibacterales bacterium]